MKRRRYHVAALATAAGFGALFMALPSSGSGVDVTMTGELRFRPQEIRIDVGGAVTFTNESTLIHTATCRGCRRDSADIAPQTFKTLTFTDPGAYLIFCRYHGDQGMVARLTVGSGTPASPTAEPTVAPTG